MESNHRRKVSSLVRRWYRGRRLSGNRRSAEQPAECPWAHLPGCASVPPAAPQAYCLRCTAPLRPLFQCSKGRAASCRLVTTLGDGRGWPAESSQERLSRLLFECPPELDRPLKAPPLGGLRPALTGLVRWPRWRARLTPCHAPGSRQRRVHPFEPCWPAVPLAELTDSHGRSFPDHGQSEILDVGPPTRTPPRPLLPAPAPPTACDRSCAPASRKHADLDLAACVALVIGAWS